MALPDSISIERDGAEHGALDALFRHSMSLREAARRGAMPPLEIMNAFMACGRDDIHEEPGCVRFRADRLDAPLLTWEPFELTSEEYDAFLSRLRAAGTAVEIRAFPAESFGEWFTRCYESGA